MSNSARHMVLLTGPSGAGLSTATNALEDAGFEAIDNLPLRLVLPLLDQAGPDRPISLGLDTRNRDFSPPAFLDLLGELEARSDVDLQLVYLDCAPDEILRRYSGTRRRHPILDAPSLADGIAREIELLRPIAKRADVFIDTTDFTPHDLRAEIERWFAPEGRHQVAVQIQSFSYKRGLPRGADLVFDCRFLRNPHWEPGLRLQDGRAPSVQSFVAADPRYDSFLTKLRDLVDFLLPEVEIEGKSYLTIAFGCTGGRHRSVTLAERLTQDLEEAGWQVSIRHRELDHRPSNEAK